MRCLVLFLLCASCWASEAVVEVAGARISAADIFPGGDPEINLGPAPAPGVRRRVTEPQLQRWARQAGVEPNAASAPFTLVRKLRSWPGAEAAETLAHLLAEEAGVAPSAVRVALQGFAEPEIPAGRLEWSLLGSPGSFDRPVRLSLRWRDASGRTGVESVTARVEVRVKALTAVRDLPAGTEIAPGDFQQIETDLESLRENYHPQFKQDAYLFLTRNIKAGELLCAGCVERKPDVERGAIVELRVSVGAVRLRAPGRAEGSGSEGDLIPFRNLATNQRVLARITDGKTAEVALP